MKKSMINSALAVIAAAALACAVPMAAHAEVPVNPDETQVSQPATPDEVQQATPESDSSVPETDVAPEPETPQPEAPVEEPAPSEPKPDVDPVDDAATPPQEETPVGEETPQAPVDNETPWVGQSTLVFSADCVPEGQERVPLIFTYNVVSGEGLYPIVLDGRTLPGDAGGFTVGVGEHTYSYTVRNLNAENEFVVKGPFTFTVVACDTAPEVIEVTPAAPTQVGDTVSVPVTEGVVYRDKATGEEVSGNIILKDGDVINIVATPKDEHYRIVDGATTEWRFTYTAPPVDPEPVLVTPVDPLAGVPACSDYTIPEIKGVVYGQPTSVQQGDILTVTIIATPAKGYKFEGEQTRTFSKSFDTSICEGPGGSDGGSDGGNGNHNGGNGGSDGNNGGNTPGDGQNHGGVVPVNNQGNSGDGATAGSNADQLAVTGASDLSPIGMVAGGLLLAGLAALLWGRRRAQSA